MKLFHTGDWHIGKLVNGFYMTEDQEFVMDQLYEAIETEKPDVVLIAGDLYDRSVPPVQAIELLDKVLGKIVRELGTPVIAIAGNHDSSERIEFGSRLLRDSGLFISGMLKSEIKPVILTDEHGPVHFYPIPYVDPPVVRELYGDEAIKSHDDAMAAILERLELDKQVRNVAIAHGYVCAEGGMLEESESEKLLTIGGTASINAERFADFHYTALGHMHGPQKVGSDRIRYSGSLLKYSFSETRQKKGITIVELDKDGQVQTRLLEFKPRRDMRVIKGELNQLIREDVVESREDYIKAVLTDKGELLDPMAKLRGVYPNAMELVREERQTMAEAQGTQRVSVKNRSELSLFESFYQEMTGKDCEEQELKVMTGVIEAVRKEETA